jgi:hypothetical protein
LGFVCIKSIIFFNNGLKDINILAEEKETNKGRAHKIRINKKTQTLRNIKTIDKTECLKL